MHLLVVRHAIAEERQPDTDDASRELTRVGERKFRGIVSGLRELGWRLDRVLTSPWQRALRTAELLSPICNAEPVASELLCQPPRAELLAQIAEATGPAKKRHATAVVGHEPWLSELVAWLAFGDPKHGSAIDLKKGGIVWLRGNAVPGGMQLRAMLTPSVLRELAE
jgi:phosphohistidine phosphatase